MMKVRLKSLTMVALVGGAAFVISCGVGAPGGGDQAQTGGGDQAQTGGGEAQGAPGYMFDPGFPKPLPNKWKIGGVMGISVLPDDSLWVYNRPNDMTDLELHAEFDPPWAECCVRPPSMIHFDKSGNVIESFNPPQGHGMATDSQGFVYAGQDTVRKYDPNTGEMVGEVPRAPERENGSANQPRSIPERVPGRGGQGPVANFIRRPGPPDPEAEAARAAQVAAFRVKYPPTTPMIVGGIEEIRIDEPARELYTIDSYLGGRVMVFDLDTFEFKRGWGAHGHALSDISTDPADHVYTPGGPAPNEFVGHVTLNLSNDGLVYVADRRADRVDVTTKEGELLKEFLVAPWTPSNRGSAGGVAFSADPEQQYLIITDMASNKVRILNREDGEEVSAFGTMGDQGGLFFGLHVIDVDSQGNIYTGEVFSGQRIQRFVPADSPRGQLLVQLSNME